MVANETGAATAVPAMPPTILGIAPSVNVAPPISDNSAPYWNGFEGLSSGFEYRVSAVNWSTARPASGLNADAIRPAVESTGVATALDTPAKAPNGTPASIKGAV